MFIENRDPAELVGFGARTSIGFSAAASCAAARASIRRFCLHSSPAIAGSDSFSIASAAGLPPFDPLAHAPLGPRLKSLIAGGLAETLAQLPRVPPGKMPVFLAMASPRPGLSKDTAELVLSSADRLLAARGIHGSFEVIAEDHAGGLMALARAVAEIAAQRCEVCIVGGVNSYLHRDTLAWLYEREQLKSERNRWGFVASEAAAFWLVTAPGWRGGTQPLTRVVATATSRESVVPRGTQPLLGHGSTAAVREILAALSAGEQIDGLVCDLNGERWRGDDVGFTLVRVSPALTVPGPQCLPALAFGDVGAASGPLFCGMVAHAAARGVSTGSLSLVWTSAELGARGATLLRTSPANRD